MRLSIDHRTTYRFTEPQARVVQLLRMTPRNSHDQTVVDWHIAVDCDARTRDHADGFGNLTTMLYAEGPLEKIEISVTGEIVTSGTDGRLRGAAEPLPPRLFLRETPATRAGGAIRTFARQAGEGRGADVPLLLEMATTLRHRLALDRGRPDPALVAEEAFAGTRATPRDLAQILIAAARALDVPARYVTGYCDLQDDHRPAPHGWMEAWVDGCWTGIDPTLGQIAGEHHARVAVALDAAGAAPVAGTRMGEGDEELDVDVSVSGEA
jgi:transglutaminase-like putative cysteine protease